MTAKMLKLLLRQVAEGKASADAAFRKIRSLPFESLGMASVDHHRSIRQGVPEVILGEGKTAAQIVRIARSMRRAGADVLVTRIDREKQQAIRKQFRRAGVYPEARCAVIRSSAAKTTGKGNILIVTAGTSDIPVAEEARETAQIMGNEVRTTYDAGVADRFLASFRVTGVPTFPEPGPTDAEMVAVEAGAPRLEGEILPRHDRTAAVDVAVGVVSPEVFGTDFADGDTSIVLIGDERYVLPDAIIFGG